MGERDCVICQRRPYDRAMVCNGDRQWLDGTLTEIVHLYATLPEQMIPGQTQGQRVSGSREAPLPLRVDPLDLTMPARVTAVHDVYGDQAGLPSVAGVLDSWARDWVDVRDMGETLPTPTVVELARWLGNRHPWACDDHPAVDDYATEIRRLHTTLRAVAGIRSDRIYVGPCPVTDDKGTCGATLTADPYLDIIRCPRCDTMWSRDKWLWLGMTIREDVA